MCRAFNPLNNTVLFEGKYGGMQMFKALGEFTFGGDTIFLAALSFSTQMEVGKWNALILERELASHLMRAGVGELPVFYLTLPLWQLCILIWKAGENHRPHWDQPHLIQKSMKTGSERAEMRSRLFFVGSTFIFPSGLSPHRVY